MPHQNGGGELEGQASVYVQAYFVPASKVDPNIQPDDEEKKVD